MQKIDIETLLSKYKGDNKKTIPVIKWDVLSKIHLSTARTLAAEGVNFRLSTPTITEAESELNRIWLDCLHGQANLDDFKVVNQKWADSVRAVNERSQKATLF